MPQVRFAGHAEVIEEDYYEFDTPPNLTVRLEIDSHVYLLKLRENSGKYHDKWYNDTEVIEVFEGHV